MRKGCLLAVWFSVSITCASPVSSQEKDDKEPFNVAVSNEDAAPIADDFRGSMHKGWRWLRENRAGWKLTDTGLQVLIEPGNMWGKANDAKNVLLLPVPVAWQESVDVSVQLEHHPKKRWEQANLVWYYSDATMVKLGLEIENGKTNIVMGREEGDRTRTIAIVPYAAETVHLRLLVQGLEIRGFHRQPDANEWNEVGKASLPSSSSTPPPQVSLQFYQGEANSERWANVRRFEMKKPPKKIDRLVNAQTVE